MSNGGKIFRNSALSAEKSLPQIYRHNGVRLLQQLDAEKLQAELNAALQQHAWFGRRRKNWYALPLRSHHGGVTEQHVTHSGVHYRSAANAFKDTPLMSCCPYLSEIVTDLQTNVYKIRAMKLDAAACIDKHQDKFPFATVCRLHIVVQSEKEVRMTVGKKTWHMAEGELWFANVRRPHSVQNDSDNARTHIVLDVDWSERLRQLYEASLASDPDSNLK